MFTLPPLPYDHAALEPFIDSETMRLHHTKHHAAYVQNLNDALKGKDEFLNLEIVDLIKSFDKLPKEILTKVKNNAGGHVNHSFFWKIMAPKPKNLPSRPFQSLIKKNFGGFKEFQEQFSNVAMSCFGSSWAWLIVEKAKLEIISTSNQESPIAKGFKPILALDLWEHAYYLRYQNRRSEYIDAWWNVINWEEVEKLYKKALNK